MERHLNIDRSFRERRGIVTLLERLERENLSVDELEEIGIALQKAGRRALSPLVRRLWREKSGDLISRYTYLLDFFEDEVWLDQLIEITLRRRDLDDDGKAALLAALQGYGVDVTAPPFSRLMADLGRTLRESLPRLLDRGEEGIVWFLDELVSAPPEERLALVRELATVNDSRVVSLLELVFGIEDEALRLAVADTLGRIRSGLAAGLLEHLSALASPTVASRLERGRRRLSFLRIVPDGDYPQTVPFDISHACIGSFDSNGSRTVCLAGRNHDGLVTALYLQLHDARGVVSAWSEGGIDPAAFQKGIERRNADEGMQAVTPGYAILLVRDALYRCGQRGSLLPADLYLRRSMFGADELAPALYRPEFREYDLTRLAAETALVEAGGELLDEPVFLGWYINDARTYDYADEWRSLAERDGHEPTERQAEDLLERFCGEIYPARSEELQRRLFLTADLLRQTGESRRVVELVLAAAASLAAWRRSHHDHPFLRRLALESIAVAREALAEGYDLRQQEDEEEDGWGGE